MAVKTKRKYAWARDGLYKPAIDAQEVGLEVARVMKVTDQQLSPALLVDVARDPKSPLHGLFEWDNEVAADSWRIQQARQVMVHLRVEDEKTGEQRIAFVSVQVESGSRAYVPMEALVTNESYHDFAVRDALRYLHGFEKRFGQLELFAPVVDAIKSVREKAR